MKDPLSETTRTLAGGEQQRELSELFQATLAGRRRVSLLLYHRDGAAVAPLEPGEALVVGRGREADLCVPDRTLSRLHARVSLDENGQVWLEDLGSKNGTRVNGQPVTRCEVSPVDRISLGLLALTLNSLDPAQEQLYFLESHDSLRAEMERELARARAFDRPLALLLLAEQDAEQQRMHRWCPDLHRLLRPFDRVGLYDRHTVEVLIPEATAEELEEFCRRAVRAGEAAGVPLRCGLALFPEAATSAEALLEAARAALNLAAPVGGVGRAPHLGTRSLPAAPLAALEPAPVLRSPLMQQVFEIAARVADRNMPVLILGESGSGKEVVARAIHQLGARRDRQLCCVNCGALPPTLLESALFGHERGAFTGAHRRQVGFFEAAQGGTVLLDEIGDLSLVGQAALLRVLENGRLCRLGSTEEIAVDVRVLAATHRDLRAMVKEGAFREDLLYRLDVVEIRVPPLRERPEEIVPLACRFIEAADGGADRVTALDDAALELLRAYPWPGNVRELRNAVERGAAIARGQVITAEDLPERIRRAGGLRLAVCDDEPRQRSLRDLLQEYETALIRRALEQSRDRRRAARLLGLPLRTLSHKMSQYGVRLKDL